MSLTRSESLDLIVSLVRIGREHGAVRLRVGDVEVELGPPLSPVAVSGDDAAVAFASDDCGCGHPAADHTLDAGCLHGCPVAACTGRAQ